MINNRVAVCVYIKMLYIHFKQKYDYSHMSKTGRRRLDKNMFIVCCLLYKDKVYIFHEIKISFI